MGSSDWAGVLNGSQGLGAALAADCRRPTLLVGDDLASLPRLLELRELLSAEGRPVAVGLPEGLAEAAASVLGVVLSCDRVALGPWEGQSIARRLAGVSTAWECLVLVIAPDQAERCREAWNGPLLASPKLPWSGLALRRFFCASMHWDGLLLHGALQSEQLGWWGRWEPALPQRCLSTVPSLLPMAVRDQPPRHLLYLEQGFTVSRQGDSRVLAHLDRLAADQGWDILVMADPTAPGGAAALRRWRHPAKATRLWQGSLLEALSHAGVMLSVNSVFSRWAQAMGLTAGFVADGGLGTERDSACLLASRLLVRVLELERLDTLHTLGRGHGPWRRAIGWGAP